MAVPRCARLPGKFQGELELAGVVGRGGLTSQAGGACCRVAELVDGQDVETIQHIEAVGDEIETKALADGNRLGDAKINLEEAGGGEAIAAEIAVAARRRGDAGDREGGAVVGKASSRYAEGDARNERRGSGAANRWACLRSAEVEARVGAGDDVEWTAGSNLNDGRYSEAAEEASCETIAAFALRALEDGAGDPAMALIVDGIGALEEWEAGVLRLERRLQIGGVVDRMRIGVAGKQFKGMREALGKIEGQGVVPGVAVGELGIDAVEWHRDTKACRITSGFRQSDLGCVAAGDQAPE
jgi:hypothetical protein